MKGVLDESEMTNGNGGPIDHLYLKNVLLKFIVAATQGRLEQVRTTLLSISTASLCTFFLTLTDCRGGGSAKNQACQLSTAVIPKLRNRLPRIG